MNIYKEDEDVFESLKTMDFDMSFYHSLPKYEQKGLAHSDETKQKISESLKGNSNKRGKTGYKLSDEFKEKQRQRKLSDNPMSNQECVDKIRQKALIKRKCPYCGMMGNPGTLARHIKAKHD